MTDAAPGMECQQGVRAPFPYVGGKSTIAVQAWARLGDVPNYVEPFAGSLAVLLARPSRPRVETVNDADGMLSNFWRAVKEDPDGVAEHADWPVNERDLHARHYWLVTEGAARLRAISGDPDAFDARIAGWWVWGAGCWIGGSWCSGIGPWRWSDDRGWHKGEPTEAGVEQTRPHLADAGRGVNRAFRHSSQTEFVHEWMRSLANRLRRVRVCCGDFLRVLTPAVTTKQGLTAVFLDPPYSHDERDNALYATEDGTASGRAREWAVENGGNPLLRIALCGYRGEHVLPHGWECLPWKARGGYGSQANGRGRANALRECVWFSPHCHKPALDLFGTADAEPYETRAEPCIG